MFAAVVAPWGLSVTDLAIYIVIVCAIVALVYVALRQFGVEIPAWVKQAAWIVVVAFVIIVCIRLVAGM